MLYKVVLTLKSEDEILWCEHSNKSNWAVPSRGAVYYALQGGCNFEVCGWNLGVWPFKWKLLSSNFDLIFRYLGRDPFNQNFRKFRSKTQWISSVQPEKFRRNWSTFCGTLIKPYETHNKPFRVCLHEGGGPQVGEVTCGGLPHLSCKCDQINMRDYTERRVTTPKRVTSPIWGTPPPCKQVHNNLVCP